MNISLLILIFYIFLISVLFRFFSNCLYKSTENFVAKKHNKKKHSKKKHNKKKHSKKKHSKKKHSKKKHSKKKHSKKKPASPIKKLMPNYFVNLADNYEIQKTCRPDGFCYYDLDNILETQKADIPEGEFDIVKDGGGSFGLTSGDTNIPVLLKKGFEVDITVKDGKINYIVKNVINESSNANK